MSPPDTAVPSIKTQEPAIGAGEAVLASRSIGLPALPKLRVKSSEFSHGCALPTRSTVDGDGAPPPLCWDDPDPSARSFAVVCEDPDASEAPYVHWLVYGIPAHTRSLDANVVGFREGMNSRGDPGFAPAAPPMGHGMHHYHFQVFALDVDLALPPNATREQLLGSIYDHVIAWGELVGTYERYAR